MAAEDQAAEHGTKAAGKGLEALKQKVGPLPLYVWIAAGVIIWWYFSRKNAATSATGAPNQQTDPAGNIGSIDPATGYVYGTPEDTAALAANNAGTGGGSGTPTSSGTGSIGGQYQDDAAWGRAAVNYLVGIGIDPTTANEAIQQFLAGQTLSTQQQADVNEAIQALGAPPQLPGPTGTPPPPVVTPPPGPGGGGGTVYAANPPSGLTVTSKGTSSIGLKWNSVKNATGYTVAYGPTSGSQANKVQVSGGSNTTTTVGGLHPATAYYFEVWADPTKPGGPHAGPVLGHTTGTPGGGTKPPAPKTYTVVKGDTLSGIANKLHYPGGWQALYAKNKGVVGPNPNLIQPGQVLQL